LNVDELVAALKSALPKNDTRPEKFRTLLKEFPVYHRTLFEWKELHNALDEILNTHEPFSADIQRADSEKTIPSTRTLRNLWWPVSVKVDALLEHGRQIEYIGKKYSNVDGQARGEIWAVKIGELRNQINIQIGLDETSGFDLSTQHTVSVMDKAKMLIGIKPGWWVILYEMNNEFNHVVYGQMHWADKKLRETAADLYQRSKELFGS